MIAASITRFNDRIQICQGLMLQGNLPSFKFQIR